MGCSLIGVGEARHVDSEASQVAGHGDVGRQGSRVPHGRHRAAFVLCMRLLRTMQVRSRGKCGGSTADLHVLETVVATTCPVIQDGWRVSQIQAGGKFLRSGEARRSALDGKA